MQLIRPIIIFRSTVIAENENIIVNTSNLLDYDNTSAVFIHQVRFLIYLLNNYN